MAEMIKLWRTYKIISWKGTIFIKIILFEESITFRNNKSRFILLEKNKLIKVAFKYFGITIVYFLGNNIKTVNFLKFFLQRISFSIYPRGESNIFSPTGLLKY